MDINLFLSPHGRLDRRGFLILAAVLFVVSLVLQLVPVIGPIAMLALAWPWTVISMKRLHDMGRSGTLAVALMATSTVLMGVATIGAGMAAGGMLASLAVLAVVGMIAVPMLFVSLAFVVWLAMTPSEAGANRFGPPAAHLALA